MSLISWPALWLQVDTGSGKGNCRCASDNLTRSMRCTWSHSSLALHLKTGSWCSHPLASSLLIALKCVAVMLRLAALETDVKEYAVKRRHRPFFCRVLMYNSVISFRQKGSNYRGRRGGGGRMGDREDSGKVCQRLNFAICLYLQRDFWNTILSSWIANLDLNKTWVIRLPFSVSSAFCRSSFLIYI